MTQISDEDLMAFADGALSEARAREIEALIQENSELQAKVERLRRGAASLRSAFAGQLDIATPDRFLSVVTRAQPSNVVSFGVKRTRPSIWMIAAAAVACAIIGFGVGRIDVGGGQLIEMHAHQLPVAANDLRGALEHSSSGAGLGDVRIALTFPQAGGGYCRVFRIDRSELATSAGLACRTSNDWTIVALGEVEGRSSEGGMTRASAQIPEALIQLAATRQGGDALDAESETRVLKAHWRAG